MKAEMQDEIDKEILKEMNDLFWKQCQKFAAKWNLATITISVPEAVRSQLERDFRAIHPDLDFEEEWLKSLKEL